MGERPLVWVQAMPLAEPGIGSKADAGLAAGKWDDTVPRSAKNGRAALEWTGEDARLHAAGGMGAAGSNEAHARKKSRRETEFWLNFGFLRFGNSGLLLRSRSWGFGGGFFL